MIPFIDSENDLEVQDELHLQESDEANVDPVPQVVRLMTVDWSMLFKLVFTCSNR